MESEATCGATAVEPCWTSSLTERELEIIVPLANGLSNREIAEQMHVSSATVAHHLQSMLLKTSSQNRTELIGKCFACGRLSAARWPLTRSVHPLAPCVCPRHGVVRPDTAADEMWQLAGLATQR